MRNCDLHDNGTGSSSSDTIASRNILVEGNSIHDNGNAGSKLRAQRLRGGHRIFPVQPPALLPGGGRQQPRPPAGLRRALQLIEHSTASRLAHVGQRRVSADPPTRHPRLRERDHRTSQQRQQSYSLLRRGRRLRPGSSAKGRCTSTTTPSSPTARTTRVCSAWPPTTSIDARNNIAYVTAAGANLQVLTPRAAHHPELVQDGLDAAIR